MKPAFPERVERGRDTKGHFHPSSRGDQWGCFDLDTNDRVRLRIVVSPGGDEVPFEHVSVSTRTRCQTWDEMCWVKSLFWDDEEAVVQFHPPKSQYVNDHPYCLHLWKPTGYELVLPPMVAIGIGIRVKP